MRGVRDAQVEDVGVHLPLPRRELLPRILREHANFLALKGGRPQRGQPHRLRLDGDEQVNRVAQLVHRECLRVSQSTHDRVVVGDP